MQWYFISLFIVIVYCLQQCCLAQTTTVRPYKFGFTIEEQQHRYEKRDERGIVMGEFGFITADGIYHVTVYATDEQGRFRILAMKNYPYESPPKSVEVLVKPKITVTTTTTPKPVLVRHNFNTEACSGCFLTNGKNKPKGLAVDDNKNIKIDIRTLAQELPESPNGGPKLPKSGQSPSIGKINTDPLLAPIFKTNENTSKILNNNRNIQSQTNFLTPKQQHVVEHTQTLPTKHEDGLKTAQTIGAVSEQLPKTNIGNTQNPLKSKANTVEEKPYIQSIVQEFFNTSNTVQVPIDNAGQAKKTTSRYTTSPTTVARPNTPRIEHFNEDVAVTPATGNMETKYTQTQTTQNPIKTKNIIIGHTSYLQNDFKNKDILKSAPTNHVPTAITGTTAIRHTQTPTTVAQLNTAPIAHTNENLPTTTNKYTGNILIKITQTPTTSTPNKPYTKASSNTDTNHITAKSPGFKSPSNTPTANSPAIMDIIIGKVLPTLMAKKGIKPAATNINVKPNAPSGKVTGSTNTLIPATGNPASSKSAFNSNTNKGNSNPSAVNGDGDLYRFKYILDYHGHSETGKRNGNKEGNYFAIGDDNVERTVEYVANENGYQPHIRWRKLDPNEIKTKENTLKDYEFVWLKQ